MARLQGGISEAEEQCMLFQWAQMMLPIYPELKLMYHIPNEGKRSKVTGAIMKAMGLKPGVPDICLPVPRGRYHGLYIELKRADGGKATKNQVEWLTELDKQGYAVTLCHGWQAAGEEIKVYLNLKGDY